jgi:hypothetical protein
MLRKPLAIAAVGLALATPASAFAMHGQGEQSARVPRNLEAHKPLAPAPIVIAAATPPRSFSWLDAGIGASAAAGCALALAGGRRVVRLRHAS